MKMIDKDHSELEREFTLIVIGTAKSQDDINLLTTMIKEYGNLKNNKGVKDTTVEFERKMKERFGNLLM